MDKYIKKLEEIIYCFFSVLKIPASDKTKSSIIQLVKFGIVGVSNTLLSYFINISILFLLSPLEFDYDWVVAIAGSFILSVLWSFYWNNKYVFSVENGKKRSWYKALFKSYISYGVTGIVLNIFLSYIWIEIFDVSKYIVPLLNIFIIVPINFVVNKLWAFKTDK
jgi:putative flippase GtrA